MKLRKTVFCVVVGLMIFGGGFGLSAQSTGPEAPFLPGITVKDPYPDGCIDCHKDEGGGKDFRLNTELSKLNGHPKIDNIVKTVPKDCLICHKGGPKPPALGQSLHMVHFQKPSENVFVTQFKGACLNCHSLDLATGVTSLKSGPKN